MVPVDTKVRQGTPFPCPRTAETGLSAPKLVPHGRRRGRGRPPSGRHHTPARGVVELLNAAPAGAIPAPLRHSQASTAAFGCTPLGMPSCHSFPVLVLVPRLIAAACCSGLLLRRPALVLVLWVHIHINKQYFLRRTTPSTRPTQTQHHPQRE